MKRMVRVVALVLLGLVLAACGNAAPLSFVEAPWADGELSRYDLLDAGCDPSADCDVVGTTTYRWGLQDDGWLLGYQREVDGQISGGEVALSADLRPRSSWRQAGARRVETAWSDGAVTITSTQEGETSVQQVELKGEALDNDCTLQLHRALPLSASYATVYLNVVPLNGSVARGSLRVREAEPVTVPAGTYDAWRVDLTFGSTRHQAWYAKEAPHLMLRYRNPNGSELRLRAWSPAAGAPLQGNLDAPPGGSSGAQPAQDAPGEFPLNIPYVALALLVQFPLMIIFPLALGWWIRRRYGVSWSVFGAGAATFVVSQVVHLPINYALGLLGGGRGVSLWPLPLVGLVAGLTSGLSEELARYVGLRFVWRRTRGWADGVQYGAGHGAVEAIIFGFLAFLTVVQILVLYFVGLENLGITGEVAEEVRQAFVELAASPAYLPVLAGLERVFAITMHILMASLVMRSLTRGHLLYLLAAIATHAVINWWAVVAPPTFGFVWTEVGLGAMAAAALYLIVRMGRQDRVPAAPEASEA